MPKFKIWKHHNPKISEPYMNDLLKKLSESSRHWDGFASRFRMETLQEFWKRKAPKLDTMLQKNARTTLALGTVDLQLGVKVAKRRRPPLGF